MEKRFTLLASSMMCVADLPTFFEDIYNATRQHSALGYLNSNTFEKINAPDGSKSAE